MNVSRGEWFWRRIATHSGWIQIEVCVSPPKLMHDSSPFIVAYVANVMLVDR